MMKKLSYNLFHSVIITNSVFHYIFISLEYLTLICPATINTALKINKYKQEKGEFSFSDRSIAILYINKNPIAPLIIVYISSFFIVIYYLFLFFDIPNWKWFKYIQTFIINFIDIVIFRYFSLFVIDAFLSMFLKSFLSDSKKDGIYSFLFFVLSLIVIYTNFSYIQNMATIININNPLLVNSLKVYPYDQLSKDYEILILLIKICISLENNYYIRQITLNSIAIIFTALVVLLNIVLFIRFTIFSNLVFYNIKNLYANIHLNNLRNSFTILNFFLTIGTCVVISQNRNWKIMLFMILVAVNATIIISYIQYYIINANHLINQPITYELLLLLIIYDSKSSYFNEKYTKIQYHCHLNHRAQCKDAKCILCSDFSTDLKHNVKYFYKYLKKNKPVTLYDHTAILLYYKMRKKSFKFFRYYYWLIQKYKKTNHIYIQNIMMMVETWLMTENDDHCGIIEDLLSIMELESKMNDLITNFSDFIQTNIKLKQPETVIALANDLCKLMNKIKTFLLHSTKENSAFSYMDNTLKNINNVLTYDTIIIRYAIECLINQPLKGLPLSNIEDHDDFLQLHYSYDHELICSINLKMTINIEFTLLKVTGDLSRKSNSNYNIISDYFPKQIAKDGNQLLYDQVDKTNSNTQSDLKVFLYPFILKNTIEYMKYSFRLMKTLRINSIIIYGQYSKENKHCLLLDYKEYNKIEILSFCSQALKLIFFKRRWIPLLNQINFKFYLHSIFKTVNVSDTKDIIDCVLDYRYYLNKANQINNELKSITEFKNNDANEKHYLFAIEEMKKYSATLIQVVLEKIETYPSGKSLFQMHFKTKDVNSNHAKTEDNKSNWGEDKDIDMLCNYHSTTMLSSTSQSRISLGTQSKDNRKAKATEYDILDVNLKKQTTKEIKNLTLFSYLIYILNFLLIITCTIFLVTQILQTQLLSKVIDLMFQFKFLRLYFNNFYITLSFIACLASEPKIPFFCFNTFIEYSEKAKEFYDLSDNFDFYDYTNKELRAKADKAQESLLYFKTFVTGNKNKRLIQLLLREMVYYEFDQSDTEPKIREVKVTFEEGVRKYINSMFRLTSDQIDYHFVPIYFLTYENRQYSLENLPGGKISLVQREIYHSFMNYFNYFNVFNLGERDINDEVSSLGKENNIMNIIFMIFVTSFNLILFILCNQNIQTSYNLFASLILNVVIKLEDNQIASSLNSKMENLSLLIQLYYKNPNDIVKKLLVIKEIPEKKNNDSKEKEDKKENVILQSTFDIKFKKSLVGKQSSILFSLFTFFFVVIISLDIVLSVNYANVFEVFDYIFLHFTLENTIMTNLALASLIRICNVSDYSIADILNMEIPKDGVLNYLIQLSFIQYQTLTDYMDKDPEKYVDFEKDIQYSCDKIFYSFEDYFMQVVYMKYGYDLRPVSTNICKKHNLLNLPSFSYLRTDMMNRILILHNQNTERDYESNYLFMTSNSFYELTTLIMFIFRPLSSFFRVRVLLPTIDHTFQLYVVIVSIYLVINIVLEVLLVIIVKCCITTQLTQIQKDLNLINNCLN